MLFNFKNNDSSILPNFAKAKKRITKYKNSFKNYQSLIYPQCYAIAPPVRYRSSPPASEWQQSEYKNRWWIKVMRLLSSLSLDSYLVGMATQHLAKVVVNSVLCDCFASSLSLESSCAGMTTEWIKKVLLNLGLCNCFATSLSLESSCVGMTTEWIKKVLLNSGL